MATGTDQRQEGTAAGAVSRAWLVAGGLMVAGLLINLGFTLAHPSGQEDIHSAIFAEYAASDTWVAVHVGQFVGVMCALAGLLVLNRALLLPGISHLVAHLAAGAIVATAAVWAVLQGLDGVGLKQAVDTWVTTTGAQRSMRLADAEIIRWLEWGFQSYFRFLLGLSFALIGVAILLARRATWLGWMAVLSGACSVLIGVDVGYNGLASALQDTLSIVFLLLAVLFAVGVLVIGLQDQRRHVVRKT